MSGTLVSAMESTRICSHMNSEHGASLAHYLEFYGTIPSSQASVNPSISNFSTPSMTLEYGPPGQRKEYTHKFSPPMYAGEARKRLEAMHQEARKGLGLSEVVVDRFDLGFSTALLLGLFTLLQLAFTFAPTSFILTWLSWSTPLFRSVLPVLNISPTRENIATGTKLLLLGPLVTAHVAEIWTSLRPVMRRFGTEKKEVRLAWSLATALGGFPVWKRLKQLGESEEHELEKKSKGQ